MSPITDIIIKRPAEHVWSVIADPATHPHWLGQDSVTKHQGDGELLTINGQPVQRQRIRETDGRTIYREEIGNASYEIAFEPSPDYRPPDTSLTVPADHFFVMGDNRFDARDSRYFGPISFRSIVGKSFD
jgi:signal peptidase I